MLDVSGKRAKRKKSRKSKHKYADKRMYAEKITENYREEYSQVEEADRRLTVPFAHHDNATASDNYKTDK